MKVTAAHCICRWFATPDWRRRLAWVEVRDPDCPFPHEETPRDGR